MTVTKFDVVVLGSGPGGYPAAIRAAQLGKSVALIEAKEIGGTCLNRGCIPSKALIANADRLRAIKAAEQFGIQVNGVSFNFAQMAERKDAIVKKMRGNVEGLLLSNKVTILRGFGKFISPHEIKVVGKDNGIIYGDKIIIATGSEPREMAQFRFDREVIHDSTSLLELKKLPKSLVIVGGGVIGCEFASLYATLGVEVVILELLPTLLSTESKAVSDAITRAFQKQGIKVHTKSMVEKIERKGAQVVVTIKEQAPITCEMALIAVGRVANVADIGLDKAGVMVSEKGFIPVNSKMETNVDGVYAIGDVTAKYWLAHVATHQGLVAASNAAGKSLQMHYEAVPSIIFTHPEAASVGLSVEQAQERGYDISVGAYPFQALGKSLAAGDTEGFAQIVTDKSTGQILGAQVVGHEAATLIAEIVVAITNELTIESLEETIHAHPTLPEAWMEAAFLADGMPLHLPPRKQKG